MSYDDWRYNDFNTKLRQEVLKVLLSKYGGQMEGKNLNIRVNQSMSVLTIGLPKDIKLVLG